MNLAGGRSNAVVASAWDFEKNKVWLGIVKRDGSAEVRKMTPALRSHTNLFGVAEVMKAIERFYYSPELRVVAWEGIPIQSDKDAADDAVASAGLPSVRAHKGVEIMFEYQSVASASEDIPVNMAKELTAVAKELMAEFGIQYDNIRDAVGVTGNAGYETGGTDIWYMSDSFFRDGSMGFEWLEKKGLLPDPKNLKKTHVFIGRISERDLNKVYRMMQGEEWSPNGEARTMIRRKSIGHTSMSIGDVIIVGSKTYMVDSSGFAEL